jgi:hypothetical protein
MKGGREQSYKSVEPLGFALKALTTAALVMI